jgi:arsenate reductase
VKYTATIYHNPRCGQSRKTLQLLRDHKLDPTIIEYLRTPPSRTELKRLLKLLGLNPRELMRTKEKVYRDFGFDDPALSDAKLIDAMVDHPILIERPIVVIGDRAVLGRPPENVMQIL